MHFYLDHDWIEELGEAAAVYRPPLDMAPAVRRTPAGLDDGGPGARGPVPDAALEVVHPFGIPGQPVHAVAVPRRPDGVDEPGGRRQDRGADNDWVEAVNRNGVMVVRAIVCHRMPEGIVFVHHAQERTIDVPIARPPAAAAASTTRSPGCWSNPPT